MLSLKFANYDESWRARWDEFADLHGTLFHKISWLQTLQKSFGYQARHQLILDDKNEIAAVLPLCIARNLRGQRVGVSLPFVHFLNPACRSEKTRDFLIAQCPKLSRDLHLHYLELRLDYELCETVEAGRNNENVTFVLPLDGDEKAVLALASGDNRRRTRLVYQGDWFETSLDKARLPEFYEVYRRRQKQLGSPAPALSFFANIRGKLPENVTLLTVADKRLQKVVGGMFLLADGATLYYHWGATRVEYNAYHLNHFMYREAILFSLQKRFRFFDLGRSPRSEQGGTYRFKEQFGAEPKSLFYYRFGQQPQDWHNAQKTMKPLIEIWKKTPAFLTDGAGHYLIGRALP